MNGTCFKFRALQPSHIKVHVDESNRVIPEDEPGKDIEIEQFAMGALAGFEMALDDMRANGWKGFAIHDRITIRCVEVQPANQPGYSEMALFEVNAE